VGRFGEYALWFAFTSGRFDHSSDLPPEANAGNRFYGEDVASFITDGLIGRGLDASFLDEDWGWQAHAKRPDESVLEISIYHNRTRIRPRRMTGRLMLRALPRNASSGCRAFASWRSTRTRFPRSRLSFARAGSRSGEHRSAEVL